MRSSSILPVHHNEALCHKATLSIYNPSADIEMSNCVKKALNIHDSHCTTILTHDQTISCMENAASRPSTRKGYTSKVHPRPVFPPRRPLRHEVRAATMALQQVHDDHSWSFGESEPPSLQTSITTPIMTFFDTAFRGYAERIQSELTNLRDACMRALSNEQQETEMARQSTSTSGAKSAAFESSRDSQYGKETGQPANASSTTTSPIEEDDSTPPSFSYPSPISPTLQPLPLSASLAPRYSKYRRTSKKKRSVDSGSDCEDNCGSTDVPTAAQRIPNQHPSKRRRTSELSDVPNTTLVIARSWDDDELGEQDMELESDIEDIDAENSVEYFIA